MSDWVASVLWDVELAGFTGDWFSEISGVIRHQAFSPDDRLLVAGSSAGEVLIWNLATDPPVVERLSVLPGSISALTINRDGSLLAVASSTGAIAVWDLSGNTPAAIGHIQGADSWIWSLSFASDGTSLIALDDIGVVSLWDLSPASWQLRACTIANRNLTREEWERYIPGLPYQATCPNLPLPADLSVATPVGERVVAGGAVSATPAVPTGTA
jgi:WD40 repeat protein